MVVVWIGELVLAESALTEPLVKTSLAGVGEVSGVVVEPAPVAPTDVSDVDCEIMLELGA